MSVKRKYMKDFNTTNDKLRKRVKQYSAKTMGTGDSYIVPGSKMVYKLIKKKSKKI